MVNIPAWVALTIVLGYVLGQALSAYKWWIIARSGNVETPFLTALRAYFVGMFANFFGLGLVGGDVARGLLLAKGQHRKTPALASVVADRAHGLCVLALIGIFSALLYEGSALSPQLYLLLLGVGFTILISWFIAPPLLLKYLPNNFRLKEKIEHTLSVFPNNKRALAHITAVSVAFHFLQICLHYCMILGFEANVSFASLFVVIPVINILSSLPISWNGLGVRENGYIFFLSPLVLTKEQAVAMGAIWLLAVTCSSLIGGLIALVTNDYSKLRSEIEESSKEPSVSSLPPPQHSY